MPRNRGRKASVDVAGSVKDHGREARKRSRGKHTGRAPNEAAGRRPRDLDTGVDDQSAFPRFPVASTGSRARGPERAVKASDRSMSSKVLQTAEIETDRPTPLVEDSYSSAYSSTLSFSPDPYDGKPNQHVFDEWVLEVKNWVSLEKLSRKEVMYYFPRLVTGEAKRCFQKYVLPTLRSRKWKAKEVFELL